MSALYKVEVNDESESVGQKVVVTYNFPCTMIAENLHLGPQSSFLSIVSC
jgi:hypothetical protein